VPAGYAAPTTPFGNAAIVTFSVAVGSIVMVIEFTSEGNAIDVA
jgi:hypothetical protein